MIKLIRRFISLLIFLSIILASWSGIALLSRSPVESEIKNVLKDIYLSEKAFIGDVKELSFLLAQDIYERNFKGPNEDNQINSNQYTDLIQKTDNIENDSDFITQPNTESIDMPEIGKELLDEASILNSQVEDMSISESNQELISEDSINNPRIQSLDLLDSDQDMINKEAQTEQSIEELNLLGTDQLLEEDN